MMVLLFRKVFILFVLAFFSTVVQAQPGNKFPEEKNEKPYQVLTSGKQVTIKSVKNIKNVMVWTSGGNRIIEEKNINAPSFIFRITVNEKLFFMMVQMADGKSYSGKIGVP